MNCLFSQLGISNNAVWFTRFFVAGTLHVEQTTICTFSLVAFVSSVFKLSSTAAAWRQVIFTCSDLTGARLKSVQERHCSCFMPTGEAPINLYFYWYFIAQDVVRIVIKRFRLRSTVQYLESGKLQEKSNFQWKLQELNGNTR